MTISVIRGITFNTTNINQVETNTSTNKGVFPTGSLIVDMSSNTLRLGDGATQGGVAVAGGGGGGGSNAWADITGKPTTLAGFGITDAVASPLSADLITGSNRIKFQSAGVHSFMDFTVTQFGQTNNTVLSSVKSINLFLDSNGGDSGQAFRIYNNTDPDNNPTEDTYIFKVQENGNVNIGNHLLMDQGSIVFEGTADDDFETTLTPGNPTQDNTITLPDVSGTIITTGNADAPATTTSSGDADFVLIDDGGTMKKITPTNLGIGGGGGGGSLNNVVEDTTPQLGGTLEANGNLIQFGDSASATDDRLQFGANQDLHIYHDSNFNNNVIDGISGHLIIRNEPSNTTKNVYVQADNEVLITTISANETMAKFSKDGGVELYYDDHKKVETTSAGISVVNEAHIEGATPYLTLKRTDNANVPMIRFLGSGGAAGSTIGFDGTSGTVNEMIFQTYDGSLNERLRVQTGGVKITGSFALGTSGTEPTSSGDAGEVGEVRYTDNYIYIKTSAGWKRANLSGIV